VPVRDARATTPAGGFASTVEDLARFAMWQFRVLDGAGESVLGQPTLQEMHAVQWSDPDWGLGFSIWNMGGKKFVGHQGGCPGYKSQFILCPEDKFAVVAMINATDAPQFTLVFRAHEIFTSSLHRGSSEAEEEAGYTRYVGFYTGDESWSAAEVLVWDSSLTVMWVPTPDPLGSLVKLARTDGEVFRQVQADGKPGKHYVFQPNAAGDIVGMRFNSNLLAKSVR